MGAEVEILARNGRVLGPSLSQRMVGGGLPLNWQLRVTLLCSRSPCTETGSETTAEPTRNGGGREGGRGREEEECCSKIIESTTGILV